MTPRSLYVDGENSFVNETSTQPSFVRLSRPLHTTRTVGATHPRDTHGFPGPPVQSTPTRVSVVLLRVPLRLRTCLSSTSPRRLLVKGHSALTTHLAFVGFTSSTQRRVGHWGYVESCLGPFTIRAIRELGLYSIESLKVFQVENQIGK